MEKGIFSTLVRGSKGEGQPERSWTNRMKTFPKIARELVQTYDRRRYWTQWADQKKVAELDGDIGLSQQILLLRKSECMAVWTKRHLGQARSCMDCQRNADVTNGTCPWLVQSGKCFLCCEKEPNCTG